MFRGKLLEFFKQEYEAGTLPMTGGLSELADAARFAQWLTALYEKDWVAFVEPPKDREPERALKYLARYTYRVAISNQRLESIEGKGPEGRVTFWYKDYAHDGTWDRMTLSGMEFLRRLMQTFCRAALYGSARSASWPTATAGEAGLHSTPVAAHPAPIGLAPNRRTDRRLVPPLPALWRARLDAAR